MDTFKNRLRELRLENDEKQSDIATLMNASKMCVSHWESGHSEPSIAQLIELGKHFNVSLEYLVGIEDVK